MKNIRKIVLTHKYIFSLFIILIFIFIGLNISRSDYYDVNLNLSFNLNTKISWHDISERYVNIINMYDTKNKKNEIIETALNIDKNEAIKISRNIKINPDVYARQLTIEYLTNNKKDGIDIVNAIANNIIQNDKKFEPNKMVNINKKTFIDIKDVKINKKLDFLIFLIWGSFIGIGILFILEEK